MTFLYCCSSPYLENLCSKWQLIRCSRLDRKGSTTSGLEALSIKSPGHEEQSMFDLVLLALGLAFFALSVGYAYACERL